MSTEPFVGEIKALAFNFAPKGYANCWGQLLSISQNTALFALLGTIYGGNGVSTFALPNLGGRIPLGQSTDGKYTIGQSSGSETTTLLSVNLPMHIHPVTGTMPVKFPVSTAPEGSDPTSSYMGTSPGGDLYGPAAAGNFLGNPQVSGFFGSAGSTQPTPMMKPFLAINYSIALVGIFPSRN